MKKNKIANTISVVLIAMTILSACGGGSDSGVVIVDPIDTNTPPVIHSSQTSQVAEDNHINVNISVEATDDAGIERFEWTQKSGITVTLENANTNSVSFIAPRISHIQGIQELVFTLVVTDLGGKSTTSDFAVEPYPNNQRPVVAITSHQDVESRAGVSLTASASDVDGQISSYSWQQTSGQSVEFNGNGSNTIDFNAPDVSVDTTLVFELTVTDDSGDSATDETTLTVKPSSFAAEVSIYSLENDGQYLESLSMFGDNLMVTLRGENSSTSAYKVLELNANEQLVEHNEASLGLFDSPYSWYVIDQNNDGYRDVVYAHQVEVGDFYPHAQIGIRFGTANGSFSEPKVLGVFDDGYGRFYISRMVDVNGDGHLDLAIEDTWNTPIEFWFAFRVDSDSYQAIAQQEMLYFDGHGTDTVAQKLFADIDGDNRNELFGLGQFANCVVVGKCGVLRWSTFDDNGQYQDWQVLDERILQANGRYIRDVDLDGIDDIVFSGYEEPASISDPDIEHHMWFKFSVGAGFEAIAMPKIPNHYVDLFNVGSDYFVDVDDEGMINTYRYDSLSRTPVVDKSIAIASEAYIRAPNGLKIYTSERKNVHNQGK